MPRSTPALVEPSVLRWARESVNLTPVAAARKMQLPDDRVEQWETGASTPTIVQLRKAAEAYKRPLGVFFLAEPPADFDAMRDFRRHAEASAGEWSAELHGEYRRAIAQREAALELAEIDEKPPLAIWRLEPVPDDDEQIAGAARTLLLDNSPLSLPRASGTKYDHLNTWTAALEEVGILVMATSGGRVSTTEMRAFSLYYDSLPVIMVNGSDAVRGRLFSMLHEYAHLILHTGGLCDTITDARATDPDRALEARCNRIAAAVLMPRSAVLTSPDVRRRRRHPDSWDYSSLRAAAAPFGVSAEAFARRLLTLGYINQTFYQARRAEFIEAYQREESQSSIGGGNWYRTTARDLGKGYVRRVADARRRRVIDSHTAASFLNVKVDQIDRLAQMAALSEYV
ncbi:XRE family transcriptional regulator [Saccharothrix variisporea]|uniref:Zn-dependent peptidase ImmA (M78 family) n=1 Tax=Saccharothrix variisporea TaxID=543527 RepID=A0A495XCT2_9PSEU|nr:XRE family transcriptional regulator [Saccharothrix variisporea]RKT69348.1 Zn-dependent peptidase ImmA (M78 family) [Saccharothrix variisporea]